MATKRMLVDATHPEETRVVVVDGNRLDELEFESASRKQLKGNIYLAKVTRVEPSLQAAFVEYGGNRHGFLAFNEIHPDYYQIPVSDREALQAEADEHDSEEAEPPMEVEDGESVEESGSDDSEEVENIRPKYRNQRRYKIQEVIKKRQIILIQVVKEERGNKGAALTTYLSLAGRYCVLMPNTDKGGGISRKISNAKDRKRLKSVLSELSIPKGTAVIVRTAGAERSKAEIKRDFEYLMRLWSNIRDVTLQSQAPSLIYEEANLIKRCIRDMYSRDIDEVLVEGEDGYRTAKDFMKMLIPSHAKKVQPYRDELQIPLFHRYQVEGQLDAMHSPTVQLPSGGYIVINPTEALVAIDVNSGRSTKERNIEETALKTNLEAANEIARSLRLRDLAGLVVVDFIDMEINRNQAQVERRMKEALKNDRARIQIGRISPFGLLEMSRQRLRPSFTETSTEVCPHCQGTGVVRSLESAVLHILRIIEEEGIRRRSDEITVSVPAEIALYLLNHKRVQLASIEERYQMTVVLSGDESLIAPDYRLERVKAKQGNDQNATRPLGPEDSTNLENIKDEVLDHANEEQEEDGRKRRRRRRGRRRKNDATQNENSEEEIIENAEESSEEGDEDKPRKRRRRGKRGGRRRGRRPENGEEDFADSENQEAISEENSSETEDNADAPSNEADEERNPQRRGRRDNQRSREIPIEEASLSEPSEETSVPSEEAPAQEESTPAPEAEEKPKRRRGRPPKKAKASEDTSEDLNEAKEESPAEAAEEKPKRRRGRPSKKDKAAEETASEKPDEGAAAVSETPAPVQEPESSVTEEPAAEEPVKQVVNTSVMVKTSDGTTEEVTEDKPKRKGWWSR